MENAGFVEALYLSEASLTTGGFGDVVAGSHVLRLVTILEAASGLAVIAAAIAYVTAVYPRVSLVRAAASWATDLEGDTELGAARLVCHGGRDKVARLAVSATNVLRVRSATLSRHGLWA